MTTEIEIQREIGSLLWVNGIQVKSLDNISDDIGVIIRSPDGSEFQVTIVKLG